MSIFDLNARERALLGYLQEIKKDGKYPNAKKGDEVFMQLVPTMAEDFLSMVQKVLKSPEREAQRT